MYDDFDKSTKIEFYENTILRNIVKSNISL